MTLRMQGRRLRAPYLRGLISAWPSRVGTNPFDPKYSPHLLYRDVINFLDMQRRLVCIACCNALGETTQLTLRKV